MRFTSPASSRAAGSRPCRRSALRVQACCLSVVAVNPSAGVDRPRTDARMTSTEPEGNETCNDHFAKHDNYLRLPFAQESVQTPGQSDLGARGASMSASSAAPLVFRRSQACAVGGSSMGGRTRPSQWRWRTRRCLERGAGRPVHLSGRPRPVARCRHGGPPRSQARLMRRTGGSRDPGIGAGSTGSASVKRP